MTYIRGACFTRRFTFTWISIAALALVGVVSAEPDPSTQRDWPAWSGPDQNLTSLGNGTFERPSFGLETLWSRPLGSAYSGISVVDGRLVTAFSDGEADYLVALDAASGIEQWRYRISDTYKGHDGSDDGPLASPAIAGGTVFGLGAWGRLFAVGLEDGREVWAHDLVQAVGARKPEYGFTSTPAVVGDLVVVEGGGDDGRSIVAFDRRSGDLRWSTGEAEDEVAYQSPQALTFGDQTILVAVTNQYLYGLEPETGNALFQHRHSEKEGNGFAQPVPVGDDSILLTDWPESALFRVAHAGGNWNVEEVWRSRALRGTYAIPAPYEGYLYGFSGNFLTCVDAATGKTVWKSRPPGQGNLVLVDGHLVIQTRSGEMVVAEATPEGYREKTRVQALDRGYFTRPSFAGGKVYVRNLTGIAAVGVTEADSASAGDRVAATQPIRSEWNLRGKFGDFVKKLVAAEDKATMIDRFLAEHPQLPIVEDDWVHFVYRGEVDDLAVSGNLFHEGAEHSMHRVDGTDLYFLTAEVPKASHFTYRFAVFDEPMTDPSNPRQMGREGQEQSVLTTLGWQPASYLNEPKGARGRIEKLNWKSELLENERDVQIYLPPGYDENDSRRYPLLVVNHGDQALSMGGIDNSLDNLIGQTVAPVIVALVPRRAWAEFAGSGTDRYAQAQVEELIPLLDRSFRTQAKPEARAVAGPGSAAFAAVYAALKHPGTFSKVAAQSYYHGDLKDDLMATIDSQKHSLEFLFHRSSNDYKNPAIGLDAHAQAGEVMAALEAKGHKPRLFETSDGAGWGMWQARTGDILEAFFPLK